MRARTLLCRALVAVAALGGSAVVGDVRPLVDHDLGITELVSVVPAQGPRDVREAGDAGHWGTLSPIDPDSAYTFSPWGDLGLRGYVRDQTPVAADPVSSEPAEVQSLPGLPGSMQMCLSAFATLGVFQVLRNTRKMHLSNLPEWYHAGGPLQVGHAYPLDLDLLALPIGEFTSAVTGQRPILTPRHGRDEPVLRLAQCVLIASGLRGPPPPSR